MSNQSPIKNIIRNVRRALNYSGLDEKDVSSDPFDQFDKWMQDALAKETFEPNAMTLATASVEGKPTARTVLLKDYSADGFTFFTNFNSRKGYNLESNPYASLVFYWGSLSRQVLIDGEVIKSDRQQAIDYFHSRPRGSQIAAFVSNQSQCVANRDELAGKFKAAEIDLKDQPVPCPEHWGGYCLKPERIEFWQGRPDRMHDRICYLRDAHGKWYFQRLAP